MIRIVKIVRGTTTDQETQSIKTTETLQVQLLLCQELEKKTNGQLTFLSVQKDKEKEQARKQIPIGIVKPLPIVITID